MRTSSKWALVGLRFSPPFSALSFPPYADLLKLASSACPKTCTFAYVHHPSLRVFCPEPPPKGLYRSSLPFFFKSHTSLSHRFAARPACLLFYTPFGVWSKTFPFSPVFFRVFPTDSSVPLYSRRRSFDAPLSPLREPPLGDRFGKEYQPPRLSYTLPTRPGQIVCQYTFPTLFRWAGVSFNE